MKIAGNTGLLSLVIAACAAATVAQEPASSEDRQTLPDVVQKTAVIKLAHAHAEDVARALVALKYRAHVSAVEPTKLLVRGLEAEVAEIEQKVVPMIDVAGTAARDATVVDYIPLHHQPAALIEMLHTVVPRTRDTNYAIDHVNRMLVVRADKPGIEEVRRLVEAIDRPAAPLHLQFFFIRGRIGGDPKGPSNLPEELAPVAGVLTKNGLSDLSLIAPMIVNTRDGDPFEARSTLGVPKPDVPSEPLTLAVVGSANLIGDATAQLDIEASVQAGSLPTSFQTQTTVAARLGAYTILAAAPGTTTGGEAIAVVLRITGGGQ